MPNPTVSQTFGTSSRRHFVLDGRDALPKFFGDVEVDPAGAS